MENIKFKLAMGQILVEGGQINKNLERACKAVKKAAERGCSIIVLPECLDIGWTYPEAKRLAEPIPGKYTDILSYTAQESHIYITAGLTERDKSRIYSAAVFISPRGKILLKYRKINILTIAQDIYSTGDSLSVVKIPLGTVGVNICADNFPSSLVLGHSLARMGAEILLSPSAWAVDAEHDNKKTPYGNMWKNSYMRLARIYDMTVVGVSNVGRMNAGVWKGRKCIGCSLAVGPGGNILAEGPYGELAESLIVIQIEVIPRKVTGTAISEKLIAIQLPGHEDTR